MNKVLVTGATGFSGAEQSRQLAARKIKPRLAVLRPERGALSPASHLPVEPGLVWKDLGVRPRRGCVSPQTRREAARARAWHGLQGRDSGRRAW